MENRDELIMAVVNQKKDIVDAVKKAMVTIDKSAKGASTRSAK
jgi:hypothetical protein